MSPEGVSARKRRKQEDDVEKDVSEPSAIVKVTKPSKRGRTGKLAALTQMPLDILYEILCYLTSADLLKLSRMSKAFRRVLLNSSSVSVWKAARRNIGLPECPPDMTEPQWANLAFSSHCHYCFTNGVRSVEWRFRMRVCAKCAKQHLTETRFMPRLGDIPSELLVPNRPAIRHWKTVYVTAQYEKVLCDFSLLAKAEDTDAFLLQRKKEVVEITAHAQKCEIWAKNQNEDRAMKRDRLRVERKNAIVQKLKALGWEKDLESIRYPDDLGDHKHVKAPQRLTERIWANIQGPVIEFMTEMRKKRIERERKAVFMQRKRVAMTVLQEYKNSRLPDEEIMPEAADFCHMSPVKAVIDQSVDVSVDAASFSHIIPEFPSLFATWRDDIRLQLCSVLQRSDGPDVYFHDLGFWFPDFKRRIIPKTDEEALAMLDLASTIFVCRDCGPSLFTFLDMGLGQLQPIFYPEVLGHTCLTRRYIYGVLTNNDPADPSLDLTNATLKRTRWSPRALTLNASIQCIAEELILESGLDPKVATTTDMDELNMYYACLSCAGIHTDARLVAPVYKWRDAVSWRPDSCS
ncbi:hypothetical protein AX15_000640 [Amanita polypyramis BW_CC]|nr:hypothetical protein AX15_000640 [Amanita polypyramis BW_CC]